GIYRPDAHADHAAGRPVLGVDLGAAGLSDPLVQRAVLFRRHEPLDRGRRGARHRSTDGIAPADAELRGLPEEIQGPLGRVRRGGLSVRVAFLGPPGAGKGTQARERAREWARAPRATGDMPREGGAGKTPRGVA